MAHAVDTPSCHVGLRLILHAPHDDPQTTL
jgi:hypothetical protein